MNKCFSLCNTKHSLDKFWFLLQACQNLLAAVNSGDMNRVKILVETAHDNCTTDDDDVQYTPLMLAAANGRVDLVQVLLDGGANIETRNPHGWTSLHVAAFQGHLEVCRKLLDSGAEVNPVSYGKKNSPLHSAARNGHLPVVKLLVGKGASTRLRNRNGKTAGALARRKGYSYVARWLSRH
jgi:ankyrin repeat protein